MNIHKIFRSGGILICCIFLFTGCKKQSSVQISENVPHSLIAYSSAFVNNGNYPKLYTCDSLSISPPIAWKNAPSGTNAYAITMHHIPITGDKHVYMVLYNIPGTITSIPQSVSGIGLFGINSLDSKITYSPPCSQGPGTKAYIITVYALSSQPVFSVAQNAITMDVLLNAISNTKVDTATITVNYTR